MYMVFPIEDVDPINNIAELFFSLMSQEGKQIKTKSKKK